MLIKIQYSLIERIISDLGKSYRDLSGERVGKKKKVDSREIGLEMGLLLGRFFQNSDDLHYGYWPEDLEVQFSNFSRAQTNHSEYIIDNIPENTKTILDVGAGAGGLASTLLVKGFSVDCVSPSEFLSNKIADRLGESSEIFRCKYEELNTDKRYDLLLFSESFQYINVETGLKKSSELLNDMGHMLICDFFRTDAEGKNPLQAGHNLAKFYAAIENNEFENIKDEDITRETAPTIQILGEFLSECLLPLSQLGSIYLNGNYPRFMKLLKWKFNEKFDKLNRTYFSGQINTDAHMKYVNYRLLLYKKIR